MNGERFESHECPQPRQRSRETPHTCALPPFHSIDDAEIARRRVRARCQLLRHCRFLSGFR